MSTAINIHHNLDLDDKRKAKLADGIKEIANRPPSQSPHPWIIMDIANDSRLVCLRCGEDYQPTYPIKFNLLGALIKGVEAEHGACDPHPDGDMCVYCDGRGHVQRACLDAKVMTPEEWWKSKDTGLSSKTIWCVMMQRRSALPDGKAHIPHDPDDFGRCYRLMKRFPEWTANFHELTDYPAWRPLVCHWDDLTKMYEAALTSGGSDLLARMKELNGE